MLRNEIKKCDNQAHAGNQELSKFIRAVTCSKKKEVESILESLSESEHELFLNTKHRIKDKSYCYELLVSTGRVFDCTVFQYACWALDYDMCHILLKYMSYTEALDQIIYLEKNGTEYGNHFDYVKFKCAWHAAIEARDKIFYNKQWAYLSECEELYRHIAELQGGLPAHIFYAINCNSYLIRTFDRIRGHYSVYNVDINKIIELFNSKMELYQKLRLKLESESTAKHQIAASRPIQSKAYTSAIGFWIQRELQEKEQGKAQIRSSLGLL